MQVSVLLQVKGSEVITVTPEISTTEALAVLARHRIGAVVVSSDGQQIDGVLSERDVVRALAAEGGGVLDAPVRTLMSTEIITCQPDTTIDELMTTMTERRVRHVPVLVDGRLAGLVSIGDVVKDRISVLENETKVLHDYISNPY